MRVALVQCCSSGAPEDNLSQLEGWIVQAAREGARLICLPEAALLIGSAERRVALAEPVDGPLASQLAALAARLGCWINLGGFAEALFDADGARSLTHSANTSLLFDPHGQLVASYRKMHLFDLGLPDARFEESASTAAGDRVVCAEVEGAQVGLTICYDLRFPELYRSLRTMGAQLLLVPSAFTVPTGAAHWHTLLRARAIENQCWVIAAAQTGHHPGGDRRSYGHSLVVDPWGTVRLDLGEEPGVAVIDLDLDAQRKLRERMPVFAHRRPAPLYAPPGARAPGSSSH